MAEDKDLCYCRLGDWELESGHVIYSLCLAYRTWGRLSEDGSNAVVVCHDWVTDTNVSDWWHPLFGRGRALDTSKFFVICINSLGSPFGSDSPCTPVPGSADQSNYGPHFPLTTIRDDAKAQLTLVRDHLKAKSVFAAVGAGMGGMTALEWACEAGDYVQSVVSVSAGVQQGGWAIAWGETVRNNIFLDPAYQDGYYDTRRPPSVGLEAAIRTMSLARQSEAQNVSRSQPRRGDKNKRAEDGRVRAFASKFDANCLVALTRKLDTHDILRDRECSDDAYRLFSSKQRPALFVGNRSDWLHPPQEQEELADLVEGSEVKIMNGVEGHELNRKSLEELNLSVMAFLDRLQT